MTEQMYPIVLLFSVALIKASRVRKHLSFQISLILDLLFGAFIWCLLPKPSIIPWWGTLTFVVSRWPRLIKNAEVLAHGGPLGPGCSKAIEVLCGIILWRIVNEEWPEIMLGPLPSFKASIGIFILSGGVNLVLYTWSRFSNSRGDHDGVNEMVELSIGRSLTLPEHVRIFSLALLNGACEEVTSRFFWMMEFQRYLSDPNSSNLCQAAVFGAWHYHGIPSGLTGVALTFVYGGIMGFLFQYGEGLMLPVIAHTIADYYIFASIVRQQDLAASKKQ